MKEVPIGDIFSTVWPTISKWGSKFFIALAAIFALGAAAYLKFPLSEYVSLPGIVVIAVTYFAFRRQQEIGTGKAQEKARAEILKANPVIKPGNNGNGVN